MNPKPPASPTEVADRAHSIWEKAGRPAGKDLAHWLRAEAELAAEAGAPQKPRRQTRKAVPKKAAAKTKAARSQPKKSGKSGASATRKTRAGRARPRPRA